ncbi:MAG: hypothetical protein U0Q12_23490 [Vicinamibacterales bacterium]
MNDERERGIRGWRRASASASRPATVERARVAASPHAGPALPHPSRGLAILPGATRETTRVFLCDAMKRQIRVLNGRGVVVGAFGSEAGDAALEWPTDVLVVRPEFPGEDLDVEAAGAAWLVVADRGRGCLQVYEDDGAFVGRVGGLPASAPAESGDPNAVDDRPPRAGWPFFRLRPASRIGSPLGLAWRDDVLEITTVLGDVERVDLAYEMLPTFEAWCQAATCGELVAARRHFRSRAHGRELAPHLLVALETALGQALLLHHQVAQTVLVWSSDWPRGAAKDVCRQALQERFAIVSRLAFKFGAFGALRDVQHVLRAQLSRVDAVDAGAESPVRSADTRPSVAPNVPSLARWPSAGPRAR